MGGTQIFQKNLRASLFNDELSNEPLRLLQIQIRNAVLNSHEHLI
jgi:hypothetical protein